jgi:hypothetical protein
MQLGIEFHFDFLSAMVRLARNGDLEVSRSGSVGLSAVRKLGDVWSMNASMAALHRSKREKTTTPVPYRPHITSVSPSNICQPLM